MVFVERRYTIEYIYFCLNITEYIILLKNVIFIFWIKMLYIIERKTNILKYLLRYLYEYVV